MTGLHSHPRRRTVGAVAAAAALALTATLAPSGAATATPQPAGPTQAASNGRPVDVMTRNLYLGADLGPVIATLTTNPAGVPAAAAQTWAKVVATNPPERMAAVAEEIAAARPAVVGLQEVTEWTTYAVYNPITGETAGANEVYDFLDLLLEALEEEGVAYHEVTGATANNFASGPIAVPSATSPTTLGAVGMADRDVIIRRADVTVDEDSAVAGTFQNIIRFPVRNPFTGQTTLLPVTRGWGSVDVRTNRTEFRFVNAHLEAFGIPGVNAEDLRVLQVGELLAAQEAIAEDDPLSTVYVGDYNSDAPDGPAYQLLVSSVGSDAWSVTNLKDPGYTCCFDAAVTDDTSTLDERIDLVVVDSGVQPIHADVIGEELGDMTESGLWPSDHAGVLARLVVAGQRGGPTG